ncbi:uncharacterized protein LY89DRAFT_673592 [Mollisia scopiformis]|uniref:Uncharacterized protein n=1 Tax=Mollisia scopiformis TaxID=149040 RepID=A0A194WXD9_MOLSC|nr:uncharacterized protein LY89DRAFT_673592 [Mollisia scopiformis]KUJ12643.1 hypothetical protein LY89DRAFT_673592 [Mollisia scopiformis]
MWFPQVISIVLLFLPFGSGQDPVRPYPLADEYLPTTPILDHQSYISSFADPQWYLDNIPFVDFPDQSIRDVYYYRTSVLKRHLKYSHEGHGWLFTEFIHPVSWASKLQTIPDSAAHQILEGRWLRDLSYTKDIVNLYMRAGIEALGGISYTHYIHRAILEHAWATGDVDFLVSQLPGMIQTFNLWNVTQNNVTGLYHRTPLSDAQEYSLPGYWTGGPNGGMVETWNAVGNNFATIWLGPETYRPNFNAYMVSGARAIAEVAHLANQTSLAQQWSERADTLYTDMRNMLWDEDLKFWIDVVEGTNLRVGGRELIGYFPYRLDVGTDEDSIMGLEAGLTPEAFLTEFGPTTLEQTNQYYTDFKNTTYCCIWQGQSWPFSTSMYLGTLARLARENVSTIATAEVFQQAFEAYTITNYKDGVPYTAECHYPTIDEWSGDTTNHSENYLHSTYIDNLFTNLVGIVPTLDERLEMRPLIPSNWTYFAIENLPYHGSLISILWDEAGSHYSNFSHQPGLSIYSSGTLIHNQPSLTPFNITLSNSSTTAISKLASQPCYSNILSNPNAPWGLPNVTADYTFSSNGDISPYEAWKMIDGLLWYDTTPDNRWTNNQSTTPFNTMSITLPRARKFDSVSLGIYADTDRGGVIACPSAIYVYDRSGTLLTHRDPWNGCVPNALNTVLLGNVTSSNTSTTATGIEIETDFLSITLVNEIHYAVAVSEIQIWVPATTGPRYEAEDGLLGTFIGGFEGKQSGLNCTIENGGVLLGDGAWAEIADVRASDDSGGSKNLTIIGGGSGTLAVQMNFLTNSTVVSGGVLANMTIKVDFLAGGNVVTMFWVEGKPWVDAIVVAG